jgi:hypothetical protein
MRRQRPALGQTRNEQRQFDPDAVQIEPRADAEQPEIGRVECGVAVRRPVDGRYPTARHSQEQNVLHCEAGRGSFVELVERDGFSGQFHSGV